MPLPPFQLEEYLTEHEFSTPYLLGCSDAETMPMQALLAMANSEEANAWDNLTLGYTCTWGDLALRQQIAHSLYPGLTADNVLCFAGAEEGIYAATQVLCQPGQQVLVLTPCYQSLQTLPAHAGAEVVPIPLTAAEQWRLPLDRIEQAITLQTCGIMLNFPHNPTGQVLRQTELDALVNLCEHHGLWLFSDEVYRLLGNPVTPWAQPVASAYAKGLSLGVMSKAYGLAGLRIGWLACQDIALLHRIKQVKDYLSICNSAPSELLARIALRNQASILDRNNTLVADNLALLEAFMIQHRHTFDWVSPQGGCVGFAFYKGPLPLEAFCHQLRDTQGVLVLPGTVYGLDTPYIRLGFGRRNFSETLAKLDTFLK
jgi:aspartate/methionine/tyrosine aminotransferase